MCRRKAFTLIELLVVIAIIALLLAIIVPALRRVKEKAQFLFCKSNLRGYGMAMKLYLNANDYLYPESSTSMFNGNYTGYGFTVPIRCQWHDERISPATNPMFAGPLWEYMDSVDAHMCPTFKSFAKMYGPSHPGHNNSIPVVPQYAYSQNVFLGRMKSNGEPLAVARETEVVEPARVLVWVEETIWTIPGYTAYTLNDTCFFTRHPNGSFSSGVNRLGDFIATYHNTTLEKQNDGVGNAVFVDGHVELCDPYDKRVFSWGEISGSYRLAWPLRGTFSQICPY